MTDRRVPILLFAGLTLLVSASVVPRPAQAIDTGTIVASAASWACLDYQVTGVCVWLTCTPFGCYTQTSVKVRHYMPELVVSVYQQSGDNPWSVISPLAPSNATAEGGGNRTEGWAGRDHKMLRFKNADAVGHPAAAGFDLLSSVGYTCEAAATPMQPYFLSVFDSLAWRAGVPESAYPEALTPGARTISQTGDQWGHVYPRSGFVTQSNDYKAAAVIAQRVADFVTRSGQPHVYTPLQGHDKPGYWAPGPVREGDGSTGKWQRLQPNLTKSCSVFPDRGIAASYSNVLADDGDYVWALWRPYECCKRRGEELIFAS
ncbi:MAG: TIGR03756 family integrating conjugative element protein [Xanthomonadales bacterium]|nr:TIGR03756 family integrating conjugative element protein [Xanthomonadales bacterium]